MAGPLGAPGRPTAGPVIALLLYLSLLGPADLDYERGVALAREERWAEAEAAFRHGQRQDPQDKRFPLELAGIAFKRKDFVAAQEHVLEALRLDPADEYANDFAGTVFLLEGNLEAALRHWNRIGKPRIDQVRLEPEPAVDPVLLDRAFAFSPASALRLEDYRTTRARIELLDIFPVWKLELEPRDDGPAFDAVFRSASNRTWLAALRGLPFQTVYPELRNLGGRGIHITSMLRWDLQKRRASLAVTAPLERNPSRRLRLFADGRNENWVLPAVGGFNLRRTEAGGEVQAVVNGSLGWSAGASISHRRFTEGAFLTGNALETHGGITASLLRIPQRRFGLRSGGDVRLGRFFGHGAFSQAQGSLSAEWLPQRSGEDYGTSARLRAGKSAGTVPFDELFMLGVERDTDLWLRGHAGTASGKKGSAPIGPDYLLANWELDKILHETALYSLRIGPFLDTGRVWGNPASRFGLRGWMYDTGLQAKLRILHIAQVVFIWGKDLRTGRNTWYAVLR